MWLTFDTPGNCCLLKVTNTAYANNSKALSEQQTSSLLSDAHIPEVRICRNWNSHAGAGLVCF